MSGNLTQNLVNSTSRGKMKFIEIDIKVTSMPNSNYSDWLQPGNNFLPNHGVIILAAAVSTTFLLLCCITLCLLKRWKSKYYNCLQKGGEKCSPNCQGSRRPLLRRNKSSESLSKTSVCSSRDWQNVLNSDLILFITILRFLYLKY